MISRNNQDGMQRLATAVMDDAMHAMRRLDLPPDICIGATVNLLAAQVAALMDMMPSGAAAAQAADGVQRILRDAVTAKRTQ